MFNDIFKTMIGDQNVYDFITHTCQTDIKSYEKERSASLWKPITMKSIILLVFLGLVSTYPQEQPRGKQIFL